VTRSLHRKPSGAAVMRQPITQPIERALFRESAPTGYAALSMDSCHQAGGRRQGRHLRALAFEAYDGFGCADARRHRSSRCTDMGNLRVIRDARAIASQSGFRTRRRPKRFRFWPRAVDPCNAAKSAAVRGTAGVLRTSLQRQPMTQTGACRAIDQSWVVSLPNLAAARYWVKFVHAD
jgi:hypothetical protein